MPKRKAKDPEFTLAFHDAHLLKLRQELHRETESLAQQMSRTVHLQDGINLLEHRIRRAVIHGLKTLPLHPSRQEQDALEQDNAKREGTG